ncbi:MAG: zinc ABC transporter substrate-binding protein [bacterium]|nr:zinc ABC transporter substrate-binding protein [bacterium]
MRIRTTIILLAAACAMGLAGPAAAKLKVAATLSDLAWIAAEVGGEDAEVSLLCPGPQDPHYLPAKPSLTRKLRKADLLVYNGLELEVGWLPVLLRTARNNRLKPGGRGELECSLAVQNILGIPTGRTDRSQGDIHPLGNPHYLLDPRNGAAVGTLIAERMAELDPAHADAYRARAASLRQEIDGRLALWRDMAGAATARPTIVYHQHWEYLLNWLGIEAIGAIEHRPGINPSPGHVSEVIALGRARADVFVVAATWDKLDIAEKASERMGAPLAVIPGAVGADPAADGYLAMFDVICGRLGQATASDAAAAEGTP